MALVLAIEPDLRQAAILKRIVKEQVKADLVVVDSRDAAMEAIRRGVPDVLLLSALMSPRDEDELIQHLRALDGADHLQTHTIPQLASTLADREPSKGGGLLRAFRRKKEPELAAGCDPDLFADEISTFIKYAAEKKEERRALIESGQLAADAAARSGFKPRVEEIVPEAKGSSWDDPFQWNPSGTRPAPKPEPEPPPVPAEHDPWSTDYRPARIVVPAADEGETDPVAALPVHEQPEAEPPAPVMAAAEPEPPSDEHEAVAEPEPPAVAAEPIAVEPEPLPVAVAHEALVVEHGFPPLAPDLPLPTYKEPVVVTSVQVSAFTPEREAPVEEPAAVEEPPSAEQPFAAAPIEPEPIAEPEPVAAHPRAPVSLGPLATWVRFEVAAPKHADKTTTDELRELMAHLSVPPQVAGVAYARGCRIRRVRVPGGRERRKGAVPGPVILSRRQLDKERQINS